jgi:hypothetical protein
MQLVKLQLISNNNKKNGFYLYSPIVKIDNEYFRCESIKTDKPIKAISESILKVQKLIEPKYYLANGIN